jgi:hypothetical protein
MTVSDASRLMRPGLISSEEFAARKNPSLQGWDFCCAMLRWNERLESNVRFPALSTTG